MIDVRGDHDQERLNALVEAIKQVDPLLDALATESGVEMPSLRWLVCDDFVAEVTALVSAGGQPSFTTDRLGGDVGAKALDDPEVSGGRLVALNARLLLDPVLDQSLAGHFFLAAHEGTHVLQHEVRVRAGVTDQGAVQPNGIRRGWRGITQFAVDEWRADLVAGTLLSKVVTVAEAGTQRPAGVIDVPAFSYLGAAEDVVGGLHPRLPQLVESYRYHQITLDQLIESVASTTDQLMTFLGHYYAVCQLLGVPDALDVGTLPQLRGTVLYVRRGWTPIVEAAAKEDPLPKPEELAESEPRLLSIGETALEDMWGALGLTVRDQADGQIWVDVANPAV